MWFWSDWCFEDKVLGKCLINAVKEYDEHYEDFSKFDAGLKKSFGRDVLNGWEEMLKVWDLDHSQPCPYEIWEGEKEDQFFKQMQLKLAQEEHDHLVKGEVTHSSSLWWFIVQGIELQEAQ